MDRRVLLPIFAMLIILCVGEYANAQMFGQRKLGGSLRGRRSMSAASRGTGLDTAGKRFVRGNRRGEFVGSDRGDQQQFVGRADAGATPRVRSAVAGIQMKQSAGPNPRIQQTAAGKMYLPKLEISPALRVKGELAEAIRFKTSMDLSSRLSTVLNSPIEALLANRTATLRGEVASARDRRRAEILASFEPGVSFVVNELQLFGDLEAGSAVAPPDPAPNTDQR